MRHWPDSELMNIYQLVMPRLNLQWLAGEVLNPWWLRVVNQSLTPAAVGVKSLLSVLMELTYSRPLS